MEGPYSWEHDLFGSSPNDSLSEREGENNEHSCNEAGFLVSGDARSHQPSSPGSAAAPHPIYDNHIEGDNFLEVGPITGMVFPDLESIFLAYQAHAKHKGFSVTKRTSRKAGVEEYKYTVFVCDRARVAITKKYLKKVRCPARVNASRLFYGSWVVEKTCSEHNHELCPDMSILMPTHRTITCNLKWQLEANDIAGIRVCKNVRLAEVQAGGPQNLGCLPKDCRNYVDSRRRLRLGVGDAEAIRKLFQRLQHKERDFFHLMDIGENGRLRNVIWIHPRSKAAYEDFHDVVSFDTTYLVNRYKMPFATVVGVNHQGQSMLLGCALVTHEDTESFKWIFSNSLEAMSGVAPVCILTDQCESIGIAIREVMPNMIHRYCLWNILYKLPTKFKGISNYHNAAKEFKEIVFDSFSISVFERQWDEFVVKYGLQNNEWLGGLFEEMEVWFLLKEVRACKVLNCVTHFAWEKQFRDAYTNNIFKKVQQEINRMFYCHSIEPITDASVEENGIEILKVTESVYVNGRFIRNSFFEVTKRPIGEYYECNCRSFEFRGILYCHIMKALCRDTVHLVNPWYVLRRWRKDVYRRHCSIFFTGGYPHMTDEFKKFQAVERVFQQCTDAALGNTDKMDFIMQRCRALEEEIKNWMPNGRERSRSTPTMTIVTDSIGSTPILDPEVARPVGRPRGTRFYAGYERGWGRAAARGRRGRTGSRGGRASAERLSQNIDLNEAMTQAEDYHRPL